MPRLLILRAVLCLVLAALAGRLYTIQLVDSDAQRYGRDYNITTIRYTLVMPRRGEIFASDGTTRLAESVPNFSLAVLPSGLPPAETTRHDIVLARLAQIAGITSTLAFSPAATSALPPPPGATAPVGTRAQRLTSLRRGLDELGLASLLQAESQTVEVGSETVLDVLHFTERYSDMLTLHNPIADLIRTSNVRGYETVTVKEDMPQELALIVRENSAYLPGVVVVEDYRRHYPRSADIASISHMLGYIGRINACELVMENPASSWLESLLDVVGSMPRCSILEKQIGGSLRGTPLYRNDDRIGKDGLEASYEEELRGTIGIQMVGVDALERPISAPRTLQPMQDGHNLITTIDLDFQREVETILQRWIAESERRRSSSTDHKQEYDPISNGVAVVLDVHSGRILAMVSLPAYDNNVWVNPLQTAQLQNLLYRSDPDAQAELLRLAPLTNRAVSGRYPPGSAIKPLVAAIALQKQIIGPETRLRDPGRIVLEVSDANFFVLPNSVDRDNGNITIADALIVSSNVFFASIGGGNDQASNIGPDGTIIRGMKIGNLAEGLRWFGFGRPSSLRLPGEAGGRVPSPNWKAQTLREPWTTGDTYNTSIGQGYLEVTPLQLTLATAALVNGGVLYRPQLVQATTDSNGAVLQEFAAESIARVPVDEDYLAVVRDGMRRSVLEGLNIAARDRCSGLSIAGKTGTAEFGPIVRTNEGRHFRQSHAWFAGFAPYDDPQIAVVVLLEGTGDLDDGSATLAVPAVTQIMQTYFNIEPPADAPGFCPVLPE